MREAGCEVPDYMLAMKKHSKKQKRKLEREAPKRERILTVPRADKDIKKLFKRKPQYVYYFLCIQNQICFFHTDLY